MWVWPNGSEKDTRGKRVISDYLFPEVLPEMAPAVEKISYMNKGRGNGSMAWRRQKGPWNVQQNEAGNMA